MEKIFQKLALSSASLIFILLVGIFITLYSTAKPAIDEYGFNFISNSAWNEEIILESDTPLANIEDESDETLDEDDTLTKTIYGGLVPIVGTLLTTLIALAFSLPIAMGITVFLAEIAPKNISDIVGV